MATPVPPHRNFLIKSAGILVSISSLCAWIFWQSLPSVAYLAPLILVAVFDGTAHAMKKNVRETFLPVLPAIRLTLIAGVIFTGVTLLSRMIFSWLPLILAGMAIFPSTWIIPLGYLNLLIHFCALLLLTITVARACFLCVRESPATLEKQEES